MHQQESKSKMAKTPKLVAVVIGDSVGYIPKPWPRAKFKEAFIDTITEFGDSVVVCEYEDKDRNLKAVTKTVFEAWNEWNIINNNMKKNTFRLIGMREKKKGEESKEPKILNLHREPYSEVKVEVTGTNIDWITSTNEISSILDMAEQSSKEMKESLILKHSKERKGSPLQRQSKERKESPLQQQSKERKESPLQQQSKEMESPDLQQSKERKESPLQQQSKEVKESPDLQKREIINISFEMKIPTIIFMMEGSLDTIDQAVEAVKKNIPVLLIRGSGSATDLIACSLENKDNLKLMAPKLFGVCLSAINFKELEEKMSTLREHKHLISEYNVPTDSVESLKDKVTDGILHAWARVLGESGGKPGIITEACPDNATKPPPPPKSVLYGEPSVETQAKDYDDTNKQRKPNGKVHPEPISSKVVLKLHKKQATKDSSNNNKRSSTSLYYERPSPLAVYLLYQMIKDNSDFYQYAECLLHHALQANIPDVTEMLIDQGVDLEFESSIPILYETIYQEREENTSSDQQKTRTSLAEIIEFPEKFPETRTGLWEVCWNRLNYSNGIVGENTKKSRRTEKRLTTSDLLLWAVLTNKRKMAELFWKKSHEPILSALIASALLRKMSRRADNKKEQDLSRNLGEHSRIFLDRAIEVTQKYYDIHDKEVIILLENPKSVWGIQETPLQFAQTYKMYDFVAHSVPQRSFNKIWYGGDFFTYRDLYTPKKVTCEWMKAIFTSPLSKFVVHYAFFTAFLVCFSAFVMTNITSHYWPIDNKSVYEYCSYLWIFADIIEEYIPNMCKTVKQRCKVGHWRRTAWNHMNNFWNIMDAASYLCILVAVFIRFLVPSTNHSDARRFYSIGLFLMYMRYLHVLLILRRVGPTIIMLKEGLKELLRFVFILGVFIVSAGVFYHANIYPNHYDMFSPFGIRYWSFWKVIYLPYWSIYGEFKSEIEGDTDFPCSFNESVYSNNADIDRCPEKEWTVSVMSGVFALLSNLLLVNLIIAMFSFRFEKIKETSDTAWRYHRSQVIMEFSDRIPVPLSLLRPVIWAVKKVIAEKNKQDELDIEKEIEKEETDKQDKVDNEEQTGKEGSQSRGKQKIDEQDKVDNEEQTGKEGSQPRGKQKTDEQDKVDNEEQTGKEGSQSQGKQNNKWDKFDIEGLDKLNFKQQILADRWRPLHN